MRSQIRLNIPLLFACTGIIVIVVGLFMKSVLEIQFYDTYFIASQKIIAVYACGTMEVSALVYLTLNKIGKYVSANLSLVHYAMTVFSSVILLTVPFFNNLSDDLALWEIVSMTVLAAVSAFVLGQFALIINVIQSLLRNKQR
ncbi:hypothetical protein [Dyadobacter sp. LHD-138]|uniref:hypothetical protein n=1 Tax=Dyadobacter sp. LHD-138 TaxID=3071413 RepID=UPI0027E04F8A|nr:hypothetical protein [Dyadobacter sp. LHD-138]MDQ6479290.1 hypothetical protein [Dyadobacter sp. LHD-138]